MPEQKKPRFIEHVGMKVDEVKPGAGRCTLDVQASGTFSIFRRRTDAALSLPA